MRSKDIEHATTPKVAARKSELGFVDALRSLQPPTRAAPPLSPLAGSWTPPPLFQAYPQAVLHSDLEDPDHHTLRLSRPGRKVDGLSSSTELYKKKFKNPKQSLRRPSVPHSATGGIAEQREDGEHGANRKVYVLATSGYLLQYGGEGPADRYPEKTLRLGPKSVAFASDAIPGKHWVIQVLQAASDNELNPFANEKSLLGRLLPTTKAKKRATRSLLLVLDSPAHMNEWLVAIRHEILKFTKASRPPSPNRKATPGHDTRRRPEASQGAVAVSRSRSPSNLSKPGSPSKSVAFGLSGPTSPTFADSGYISSGTTLAGDISSCRSSRQPPYGKAVLDLQRIPSTTTVNSSVVHQRTPIAYGGDDAAAVDDIPR